MAEWLSNRRDDVCPDMDAEMEDWERCLGSVRCMEGLGNFTNRSGACRYENDQRTDYKLTILKIFSCISDKVCQSLKEQVY